MKVYVVFMDECGCNVHFECVCLTEEKAIEEVDRLNGNLSIGMEDCNYFYQEIQAI